MSTAGKVLTVLVTLSILFWIAMFSVVAKLNENWANQINSLNKSLEKAEQELPDLETKLQAALFDLTAEQDRLNDQLTVFRARLSDAERRDAETKETLERARLQLASVESAVKSSQGTNEHRLGEVNATKKKLSEEQARVETLKGEVAKGMDELATLRQQFKSLLEENKAMLTKLRRMGPSGGRRVRSATLRH
jgi:chromosome segregation ATPase